MSSATEILRRMLDECGVEWMDGGVFHRTHWVIDGIHYVAFEQGGKLYLQSSTGPLTPEQAIAATLGAGTCHDEGDPGDFCCSECGVRMFTDVSDTYTMIASDGRTIIKHPNFCPNCGAKVVSA